MLRYLHTVFFSVYSLLKKIITSCIITVSNSLILLLHNTNVKFTKNVVNLVGFVSVLRKNNFSRIQFNLNVQRQCIVFLLVSFCSLTTYAQLDSKHWLPPLKRATGNQASIGSNFLYLSTPETTPFDVTIQTPDGTTFNQTVSLSNATPVELDLGGDINNITILSDANSGIVQTGGTRGLIVESANDELFYVNYRISSGGNQAGSLTAKGRRALGTRFRWGGFPNLGGNNVGQIRNSINAALGILATEDGTEVVISGYNPNTTFRQGTAANGISSDIISITLDAGESYVLESNRVTVANSAFNSEGWLGASVVSNRPIAVSNGVLLGAPANNNNRDFGIDQPVPETAIGEEYVLVRGNGFNAGEFGIVIATQNNTDIFINGNATPETTLNAGEYHIVAGTNYIANNMHIRGSQDIYVYQALSGDESPQTVGLNFIAPLNCLAPDFVNNIPAIDRINAVVFDGSINILASAGASITVTQTVAGTTTPVTLPPVQSVTGTSDWESYRFTNNLTGNIEVTSDLPIVVSTFGANNNAGFAGYYSGFDNLPVIAAQDPLNNCLSSTTSVVLGETSGPGAYNSYQWYLDNVLLTGETSETIIVNVPGTYDLEVTNTDGCSYRSAGFPVFYCGAEVFINKTVDTSNPDEGDTIFFTVTVENLGFDAITNLVVNETLPAGLTLVDATPSFGTWTAPDWTVGAMSSGQLATLVVEATVDAGTNGNIFINEVTHTQDQTDSNELTDDPFESVFIGTVTGVDGVVTMTPSIIAGDDITIEVDDADLNTNATVAEVIVVEVVNATTGEIELVTLTETGANTGVFSGILNTTDAPGAGVNGSGDINVQANDVLTVTYNDALTATGGTATNAAITNVDNDTDGDGVADSVDLDDDNDGILDIDECSAPFTLIPSSVPLRPTTTIWLYENVATFDGQTFDLQVERVGSRSIGGFTLNNNASLNITCLLYTSPSPRD